MSASATPVEVVRRPVVLPTYEPQAPDRNPMFLEKRVYQGSSGRVYPLPFVDRIAEKPKPREWDAVFIENEFVQVMILPELGGRIHRFVDKTNGYDVIYYQPVIKPALVGLAGPWISGGVEFNWPQHHRPSTFLPADVEIEQQDDGSATVWLSEHDPMVRMKGMHGVRLHPERSYLELVVRVYNRTDDVQTFLWWANVATRAHEQYQSFFPPDATYVADHAKRAMSTFPQCSGRYYGVDYAARAKDGVPLEETPRKFVPPGTYAANDLSWYANIPVPTSYMCMGTQEDFCGGYDHRAKAGIVHVADHHIAPGKKQWTWGNHEFGYAWDRNLTDPDENGVYAPYIELMGGVFTDNQPDFSFLQPGETKTWSQFWYPIQRIGPAHQANVDAAVNLQVERGVARIGVAVTTVRKGIRIVLSAKGREVAHWTENLCPQRPVIFNVQLSAKVRAADLVLSVRSAAGAELIRYRPRVARPGDMPPAATEPAPPDEVASVDELYLTGLHLEQYRHATRSPEAFWREGLRRDAGDARCNLALGRWHLRRGELAAAETCLRVSVERLTERNPNPADGEAFYQLGRCLMRKWWTGLGKARAPRMGASLSHYHDDLLEEAYTAFYKASWNHAWQAAAFHALAEIDGQRHEWDKALDHVDRALKVNVDNLRARNLGVLVLRKLGEDDEATALLDDTLAIDPLDWWARHLRGDALDCDTQVWLDLALDYARAGFLAQANGILAGAGTDVTPGTAPLIAYYRAWFCHALGDSAGARRHLRAAAKASPDYCFPARGEEIAMLEFPIANNPKDGRAPYYLGNLLYDRCRHREAIACWERAVRIEPGNAVAWRNLGIGYFNIVGDPRKAWRAYDRACQESPKDARLLFERDRLWKRTGVAPAKRLRELEAKPALVRKRDDLSVELCALYNQTGHPDQALSVLTRRRFQPWEGGEGQVLAQHGRAHLALGRRALDAGRVKDATAHFVAAAGAPENLGEARHLLANQSEIHYWLGCALAAAGRGKDARKRWTQAAEFKGDFQEMSVRAFSELTYYSALALERLGKKAAAKKLLRELLNHARALAKAPATIDYFATSLPTMLLFEDDLTVRQRNTAKFLEAQARLGLHEKAAARRLLREILKRDPNHALAMDLLGS